MIDINLWEAALMLAGGLFLLGWSAERFVDESVGLARRIRLSPFAIGVVIIGFGTSLPELSVSVFSALDAHPDLSLGNAYGSCSYNIAVILGVLALVHPLRIKRRIRRYVLPTLLLATLVSAAILAFGYEVSRLSGALLLILFIAALVFLFKTDARNVDNSPQNACSPHGGCLRLTFSLALLLAASALVVWSAETTARHLGVPELAIGLTVVAAGTSLPELATSIVALRRAQTDLVLGNILGSNLFNILAVVGASALIRPLERTDPAIVFRDLPFLLAVTGLLFTRRLTRMRAAILLLGFLAYVLTAWRAAP